VHFYCLPQESQFWPLPHKENVTTRAAKGAKVSGEIEVYHLAKDPLETKNLANANTKIVSQLRKLIASEWKID